MLSYREKLLAQLRQAVRSAFKNEYSDFYRKRFKQAGVTSIFPESLAAWQTLPLLSREDLANTSFWQRLFSPVSEIQTLRFTSGTSKSPVLVVPRKRFLEKIPEEPFGAKRILSFFPAAYGQEQRYRSSEMLKILGDPGELESTVRLAKLFRIDAIFGSPYTLMQLIPLLDRTSRIAIKLIELSGERCSPLEREILEKEFPGSIIFNIYGSVETHGNIGVPCLESLQKKDNYFHPAQPYYYVEIINPEDKTVFTNEGDQGELVVTTLWDNNPLPLFRYRTGDLAAIVSNKCACGLDTPVYEVLGRVSLDRIRIGGGEINLKEAERVVYELKDLINDEFEVHYFEELDGSTVKPRLVFKVKPRHQNINLQSLEEKIGSSLRIAPKKTYHEAVSQGLILPLSITVLERSTMPISPMNKKPKIIKH